MSATTLSRIINVCILITVGALLAHDRLLTGTASTLATLAAGVATAVAVIAYYRFHWSERAASGDNEFVAEEVREAKSADASESQNTASPAAVTVDVAPIHESVDPAPIDPPVSTMVENVEADLASSVREALDSIDWACQQLDRLARDATAAQIVKAIHPHEVAKGVQDAIAALNRASIAMAAVAESVAPETADETTKPETSPERQAGLWSGMKVAISKVVHGRPGGVLLKMGPLNKEVFAAIEKDMPVVVREIDLSKQKAAPRFGFVIKDVGLEPLNEFVRQAVHEKQDKKYLETISITAIPAHATTAEEARRTVQLQLRAVRRLFEDAPGGGSSASATGRGGSFTRVMKESRATRKDSPAPWVFEPPRSHQ